MKVLVDSSVWIDFFRRKNTSNRLHELLLEDLVVTNSLILAEIIPALKVKKRKDIIDLLKLVESYPMETDWEDVVDIQLKFVNEFKYLVGISDILIFQNAQQNELMIYSYDQDVHRLCELFDQKYLK